MKPHAEMNEGPEALKRFEETMKAVFSKPKADVRPSKQDRDQAEDRQAKAKPKR